MICLIVYTIAALCWLAYELNAAPWEPLDWSLPEFPGVVDLRGDAQDGEE